MAWLPMMLVGVAGVRPDLVANPEGGVLPEAAFGGGQRAVNLFVGCRRARDTTTCRAVNPVIMIVVTGKLPSREAGSR